MMEKSPSDMEALAVIGLAFEFPQGAEDEESFWAKLMRKECCASPIPSERLSAGGKSGIPIQGASFLRDDIGAFDAPFFNITPAEAEAMDPQQRHLLETTYHAFENAGLPLSLVTGSKTSVHVGSFTNDYRDIYDADPETGSRYAVSGLEASMIANRLSWYYNLQGPSLNVDTACSSSLVAFDLACQALRSRASDMGVVGGCNLIYAPNASLKLGNMNFLSPDSRCYSFDGRANGYGRGEGVGVVLIKRLADAIRDGNVIRAIIRSSGVNQDGYTPSITQPNSESQETLIRATYHKAGLSLAHTQYVEAHGTGTRVGDPIEARAIANAFQERDHTMHIGAVKSNVGHLEGASGIAGLIKAILALERGVIPPNTNFERVNSEIDPAALRLAFPQKATPFPPGPRRASVNSFGFGGTNAHAVLDDAFHYLAANGLTARHRSVESAEAVGSVPSAPSQPYLLTWSAADREGIKRLEAAYADFQGSLSDLCYTLNHKRTSLPWKSHFVARSNEDLRQMNLAATRSKPAGCAWILTGQGAQWAGMGKELLQYPIFNESIERASSHLRHLGCEWDAKDELTKPFETSQINDPQFSQPLCTVLQVASIDLLWSVGIRPRAVLGHSSGEIAAAYAGGAISHETAVRIAYLRGVYARDLQERQTVTGAMMSVGLSEIELRPYLDGAGDVSIACYNSPRNITVSGKAEDIDSLKESLDRDEIFARKLKVKVAYHSHHMRVVSDDYAAAMTSFAPGELADPPLMVSTVTGEITKPASFQNAKYWVENLVSPVRFVQGCQTLFEAAGTRDVLEIGPHSALQGPLRDILQQLGHTFNYNSILVRNTPAEDSLMAATGNMYCLGYAVDLQALNRCTGQTLVLPKYPFDHSRSYWRESRISQGIRFREHGPLSLLGTPAADWNDLNPRWRNFLSTDKLPWAKDHEIDGAVVYPGAGMIVMALEAVWQLSGYEDPSSFTFGLRNLEFTNALLLPASEPIETQFQLRQARSTSTKGSTWYEFHLDSWDGVRWVSHCTGLCGLESGGPTHEQTEFLRGRHTEAVSRCVRSTESGKLYSTLKKSGYGYGDAFQTLHDISSDGVSLTQAKLVLNSRCVPGEAHIIHPTTLDGLLQLVLHTATRGCSRYIPTMVPTRIASIKLSPGPAEVQAVAYLERDGYKGLDSSVSVFDGNKSCLTINGYELTTVANEINDDIPEHTCMHFDWQAMGEPYPSDSDSGIGSDVPQSASVIVDPTSEPQSKLAKSLADTIGAKVASLGDELESTRIFLLELDAQFLSTLTAEQFTQLKIAVQGDSCLWVTKSSVANAGMAEGLFRTLATETQRSYATLTIQDDSEAALPIAQALQCMSSETAFALRDNCLFVSRAVVASDVSDKIATIAESLQTSQQVFVQDPPLKMAVGVPPLIQNMHFEEDAVTDLLPHQVEVSTRAIGLNFKDCLLALGQLNENSLGIECAGLIHRAGDESGFSIGERVCVLGKNTFRSRVCADAQQVIRIPDGMSFAQVAALPTTFVTAWYGLDRIARLEAGESVLIHAAAGGVGQAAIQIAHHLGATVYATVGTAEKRQILMEQYGIPEERIFSSRDVSFADDIFNATHGRGVDVVLNSLSGDLLVASWRALAAYGRFVEIGKTDICADQGLPMAPFERNATFASLDLAAIIRDRPQIVQSCLKVMASWIENKHVRPAHPLHVMPIAEYEKALRMLQGGRTAGKVVLEIDEDSIVPASIQRKETYRLSADKTFAVAGAFGGLGRTIVKWLTARGARNLLLLSRSGPRSDAARTLCETLSKQGVHFQTPMCDIAKSESLQAALDACQKTMPPVAGCIQTAMVLRDSVFTNMSFDAWKQSTDPKVHGTWNLHNLLSRNLDFFIILSSVNGFTGFGSQANYAAGNTAQDQIAHLRVAQGENAVALDLGAMADDGFLAEEEDLLRGFMRKGCYEPITRPQLHGLLDYYCDPTRKLPPGECQVALGLKVPANSQSQVDIPWLSMPMLKVLHDVAGPLSDGGENDVMNLFKKFQETTSNDEAAEIATDCLRTRLAASLGRDENDLDLALPLHTLGTDSLLSIELRNWIKTSFRVKVTTFDIQGGHSISSLATYITEQRNTSS